MNIFQYNDGTKTRFGDPTRIERLLNAHSGGSIYDVQERSKSPNPELADQAHDVLHMAICAAFELEPFNAATGTGTTEEFRNTLLEAFGNWRSKKKATTDLPPRSPTTSAGRPPSTQAPYPSVPPETKSATVSGSTSR